mmetsp:Transcript_26929/g.63252  ORF Transcript_26929/g.63252 Transcript_26929/m.63252 type:complete len:219 (-) Transcript_26929:332-988(-)
MFVIFHLSLQKTSISAHETVPRIDTRHRVGTLRRRVTAEVFLLVLAQKRIAPIATLDVGDSFEQRCTADVNFLHDGVVQIGPVELRHFDVREGHVGVLEVAAVERRVEERGSHQVAPLEVRIPNDALLERHALQVLLAEVGPVEVDPARDRDRPTGLERRGATRGDLGVCTDLGSSIGKSRLAQKQRRCHRERRCGGGRRVRRHRSIERLLVARRCSG